MKKIIVIISALALFLSACNNPEKDRKDEFNRILMAHYGLDTINPQLLSVLATMDSVTYLSNEITQVVQHGIQPLPDTAIYSNAIEQELKKAQRKEVLENNEFYVTTVKDIKSYQKSLSKSSAIYQNSHLARQLPERCLEVLMAKQKTYEFVETWKEDAH